LTLTLTNEHSVDTYTEYHRNWFMEHEDQENWLRTNLVWPMM